MTELTGVDVIVGTSTAFALTITKIVDFLRNTFDKEDTGPKWLWNILALSLGTLVAFTFEINVFAGGSQTHGEVWLGILLTGMGMGASGSAWHEILDALSSNAKRANPEGAPKAKA